MSSRVSVRRLAAVSATMFVLILAFLAGRVHGGADPAQATTSAARSTQSTPAPDQGSVPAPDEGSFPSPGGQDPDPPMTQAS